MTKPGTTARRFALLTVSAGVAVLGCELAIRWTGLDWRTIQSALYINRADADVYEVSKDPILHYRLRPGASRPADDQPGAYSVTIDRWGARGHEHPWDKPDGSFRILHFGGSTVFGALVDDQDTLSAQLERSLNTRTGREVEVWNLGHSAYVQSQVARLAQLELQRVPEVDLLLMTITNASLRPFLDPSFAGEVDYARFFDDDPYLWLENFPDPPLPNLLGAERATRLHLAGLEHSGTYRYIQASRVAAAPRQPNNPAARALCKLELLELERLAADEGVPVVYANHPAREGPPEPESTGTVIELHRPARGEAWKAIHPPPDILEAWAELLADELIEGGMVPCGSSEHDTACMTPCTEDADCPGEQSCTAVDQTEDGAEELAQYCL